MWPLKTLVDFDIFQIDDKTVPIKKKSKTKKQNQKVGKITLSVYKLQLWGKNPQTCLVASFVDIPVLVSEGKGTWNKFMTFFVSEGGISLGILFFFLRSLLQIIDVHYLFNDGCCEAHRRAIASNTAASKSCTLTHQLLLMKHLEKDLQNQAISLIISCAFFHSVVFFLTSLIFLGNQLILLKSVELHWFI